MCILLYNVCNIHGSYQFSKWYIFISQDNGSWRMKYNSVLVWISLITILYLPLRITRKTGEFQVTICVAVVALSRKAHPPHSNGSVMKQNSNHALGRYNNHNFQQLWLSYFHTHPTPYTLIILTLMNNHSNIIQYNFHTLSVTITSSLPCTKL